MCPSTDPIGASLRRIQALLRWWGVPKVAGNESTDCHIRRLQEFATDLQELYRAAAAREGEALLVTNEAIAQALSHILQQRRSEDLLAAKSQLVTSVLQTAALQANTWIDICHQMNTRCATFAKEPTGQPRARTIALAVSELPIRPE